MDSRAHENVPPSPEQQRRIEWEVAAAPSVALGVPNKDHWGRAVLMTFAPFLVIGVVTLGYAFFAPSVGCRIGSTPRQRVWTDITNIMSATMEFAVNHDGHFPEKMDVLFIPDEQGLRYLSIKTWPLDPWGRRYIYVPPSGSETEPNVITLGADGEVGGTGEDEDIDARSLMRELADR